ncbi:MAG: DUF1343 domain-containing protein [Leptonema sp. (in: Bacteria)]|nr:DUF1343 domain-containing protein [Leptonema sp. (in: bacteria)]
MPFYRLLFLALLLFQCNSLPEKIRPAGECLSSYENRSFYTVSNQNEGRVCILGAKASVIKPMGEVSLTMYGKRHLVWNGLDLVSAAKFSLLENRRFALFTNATGRDRELNSILDLMIDSGIKPSLILEPEHGLYGAEDTISYSSLRVDAGSGIQILNLYSQLKRPTAKGLQGIDTLVIDLQNLPVRCYTYGTTLTYLLEDAEQAGVEVLILDRPHPYGIWKPAGSMLDQDFESFVGTAPVPFLYTMTPGEYSIFMAKHRFTKLKLRVVQVEGFKPKTVDWVLAATWVNPSPNIPDLESALVYVGFVFFEGTNISLGRGTTRPFVYSGAPWLNEKAVLAELRKLNLKGVKFGTVSFIPSASLYSGQTVRGIQFHPYSNEFDPLRTGYEYMRIIKRLHPNQFRINGFNTFFIDKLWGAASYRQAIEADLSYDQFKSIWQTEATAFD